MGLGRQDMSVALPGPISYKTHFEHSKSEVMGPGNVLDSRAKKTCVTLLLKLAGWGQPPHPSLLLTTSPIPAIGESLSLCFPTLSLCSSAYSWIPNLLLQFSSKMSPNRLMPRGGAFEGDWIMETL